MGSLALATAAGVTLTPAFLLALAHQVGPAKYRHDAPLIDLSSALSSSNRDAGCALAAKSTSAA